MGVEKIAIWIYFERGVCKIHGGKRTRILANIIKETTVGCVKKTRREELNPTTLYKMVHPSVDICKKQIRDEMQENRNHDFAFFISDEFYPINDLFAVLGTYLLNEEFCMALMEGTLFKRDFF